MRGLWETIAKAQEECKLIKSINGSLTYAEIRVQICFSHRSGCVLLRDKVRKSSRTMLQAHVKEPQMVEINPFTTACVITCVLPCMLLLHNPTQFFHFARIKILLPWLVIKPATSQGCSNDMTAVRTFSHACCTCKAVARCLLTARVCDENVSWPFVIMLFYGKAHALHAVPSVSYSKTNGFSFLHVQSCVCVSICVYVVLWYLCLYVSYRMCWVHSYISLRVCRVKV